MEFKNERREYGGWGMGGEGEGEENPKKNCVPLLNSIGQKNFNSKRSEKKIFFFLSFISHSLSSFVLRLTKKKFFFI